MICGKLLMIHQNLNNFTLFQCITIQGGCCCTFLIETSQKFFDNGKIFFCLKIEKNHLVLIMTPEKQDKALELSKHWSLDSTPARDEVIMETTYPVNH